MTSIIQSPFEWLVFDQNGNLQDATVAKRLTDLLAASEVSDLVVISHGWKTDQPDAWKLYEPLWANVSDLLTAAGVIDPKRIVVAGVDGAVQGLSD